MNKLVMVLASLAVGVACAGANGPGSTNESSGDAGSPSQTSSSSGGISAGSGSGSISTGPGNGSTGSGIGSGSAGSSSGGGNGTMGPADSGPLYIDAAAGSLYDVPPPPAADVDQTITLTADPLTIAPNSEVYKCQIFANPFGKDVDLVYMDGTMSQGSHHFFLFNMAPSTGRTTPTPMQDCPGGGLEFHPFPYLSQQPHWVVNYPKREMGYPLSAQNALMVNVHFLNTGSTPIQAAVKITLMTAKPGVVTTHVGTIFLNNTFFSVPPTPESTPQPYTKTWTPPLGSLPASYTLFTSWSHMHRTAVDFKASANGTMFYEEKNWDSPQLFLHEPPLQMTGSTPITWSCTYYNDTGASMAFGDSAAKNVMCIYMGQYYPVVDPKNPDLIEVLN